jgi:pentatricopeptide repeat protein
MHVYYTALFDTENAMKFNKASLALMDKSPVLIKTNIERYLATFQNYVLQFFYKGDLENLERAALKLETFLKTTKIHIPRLTLINSQGKLYNILLSAYNNACMFEKAENIFHKSEKLIEENENIIDKSIKNITHQIGAFVFFALEDYENSLRVTNILLDDPDSLKFLEVYCFMLLLRLMIHYELGNYELIEYITKSTKRYLSNTEKLFKIEIIMLKYIIKAINTEGNKNKAVFKELLTELEILKNDKEENFLLYFDFISWCQSKITGKKLRNILTEKYENYKKLN